jgi:uncharacterized OB-fold protein
MAEKPVPRPYSDTKPYWDGTKNNQLWIQQCLDCGTLQFYPRGVCSTCLSSSLSWKQGSGKGTVYSYTVNYRAPHPGFTEDVPFVTAIIELEEGVRMMSNVVQCDPDTVAIGMPVRVVFEPLTDEITLPKFRPA